jgi:hypothetical protein
LRLLFCLFAYCPVKDKMFIEKSNIQFLSRQGQDVHCAINTPNQQECTPFIDCRHRIKAMHSISSPRGRLILGGFFGYKHQVPIGTINSQSPGHPLSHSPHQLIIQPPHLKIPTPNPHLIQYRFCGTQMLPCFDLIPLGKKQTRIAQCYLDHSFITIRKKR